MSSDERINKILAGFSNLTADERYECLKKLNEFMKADREQKIVLSESFKRRAKFSLGPLDSGGCPCCGK